MTPPIAGDFTNQQKDQNLRPAYFSLRTTVFAFQTQKSYSYKKISHRLKKCNNNLTAFRPNAPFTKTLRQNHQIIIIDTISLLHILHREDKGKIEHTKQRKIFLKKERERERIFTKAFSCIRDYLPPPPNPQQRCMDINRSVGALLLPLEG